jgi:kelch-like protein 28
VRFLICIVAICLLPADAALAEGRWDRAARLDAPRAGLSVTVHEGRIFAAGGSGLTTPRSEFESYDPAYDRWFPETPLPRGLEQFGMAGIAGRIYAAGGYAPDETGSVGPSAAMWSWSQEGNIWQSEAAMPAPKADFTLVPVNGRLYAIGGLRDDGSVFVFDHETRSWSTLEAPAGVTRRGAAAVVLDGQIHVIGGTGAAGASAQHDVFDPESGEWTRGPDLPDARSGVAAAVHNGRIHLFGGLAADGRTTLQTHLSWQPGEGEWLSEPDLPAPRTGADAAVLEDGIFLVGGGSGGGFFAPFTALDSTDVFLDDAS